MSKIFIVILTLLACVISVFAQNNPSPIWLSGSVSFQDSTNYPYEVILKKEGNLIVSRTFNKGEFKIETPIMPTSALVQSLGYEPVEKNIKSEVTHKNDTIIFNNPFHLEYSTRLLKEVVVTDQKVKIQEEGLNYTISNIQGSDLSDAGTMLDMMAWVPGLSLDAAENIQVFGVSGTPLLYINGIKVTDKQKLASLSSNTVKKIEVIRAPGAEYPSGTSSAIKITTTIPLKDLVNANLIERANQRNRFSNRTTANAFGSIGKFDLMASVGLYNGNSRQSATATESILAKDETLLRSLSTFQKDYIHVSRWNWLAGATLHLSDKDVFQIEYSGNAASRSRNFLNERIITNKYVSESTNYDSRNSSNPNNHTLLANYSHEFSKSSLNLSATYNYKFSSSNEDVFLMPDNILSETNINRSTYNMWTLQVDYSWKFLNKYQQNIGLYGGRYENKSNADYTFTGIQNVNSSVSWFEFYYSSNWNIKGFSVTPGVRARYENQENKSFIESNNLSFNKSYFNVVPQLSIFHRFSKKLAMNLYYKYSYSLPSFADLSPAITLSDLIYYKTGDPDLKIPRRHNVSLVFNLSKFSIVAEYTVAHNKIVEITSPINNSDYFMVRPINMSGNYYLSLSASYNLNIRNKFRLYANALLRRSHTEYYYLDKLQKKNKIFTLLSLDASYNILPNLSVFCNAIYASPQLINNRNVGYTCDVSFGSNLRLMKSRLSLRLAVDDILARSVTPYWTSFSPNLYRTRRNHYDTRGITLTATYRFTLAKKKYSQLENADDYNRM